MIAVWWGDVDISDGGYIYYSQRDDYTTLNGVQTYVRTKPGYSTFTPSYVFLVTYDRVPAYGGSTSIVSVK